MWRYHRGTVPVLLQHLLTMTRRADEFQIAELLRGRRLDHRATTRRLGARSIATCAICNCQACQFEVKRGPPPVEPRGEPAATFHQHGRASGRRNDARMVGRCRLREEAARAGRWLRLPRPRPADKRATIERLVIFAPSFHIKAEFSAKVDVLHRAIDARPLPIPMRIARLSGACGRCPASYSARGANCAAISAISGRRGSGILPYSRDVSGSGRTTPGGLAAACECEAAVKM